MNINELECKMCKSTDKLYKVLIKLINDAFNC